MRNVKDINAEIDAINAEAEATGQPVSGGTLNLLTLEARASAAVEKYEKAKREAEAQDRVKEVGVGDAVSFVYGRAANKRIESGNVLAVAEGKTGLQFNVLVGEGISSTTILVGADALIMTAEDSAAAEAAVAEAKAEAEAKAQATKAE